MAVSAGIVGLPNVGKSTLFNALTQAGAAAENFPFCTIEPNVGVVPVPDPRLDVLAEMFRSRERIPATVRFVDIAGLVAGASKGEGLGNRFLAHIREVEAIVHVVRAFEDPGVVHVAGRVDPARDIEVVNTELLLADLETVERRLERVGKRARVGEEAARKEAACLEGLAAHLGEGRPARTWGDRDEECADLLAELHLLTAKPVLYVANVSEAMLADDPKRHPLVRAVRARAEEEGAEVVVLSAALEAELQSLSPEERREFIEAYGLPAPGLDRLVAAAYRLLRQITFFTAGEKEARAWTIREGTKASQAGGVIHSDFERGFIRAEVVAYEDLVRAGGMEEARRRGLVRAEGRDYVVQDGDVILFRFHV
ncbi:MAG: redox-regulated ATPase YchF [Brockia lithotrophica]|nr:redox-regulated ATPase YchF [Brockia lithotrophica]